MMFSNKFVSAIKSNGKILREFKDTVFIPFGQEYAIILKNLNSVRAIATITIDGTDVCPGGLVVNAGQEIELERWIKNGNLTCGNKFKFISRTAEIEQHRGIKLEDGIIRVEFQYEAALIVKSVSGVQWPYNPDTNTGYWLGPVSAQNCSITRNMAQSAGAPGITVPGSKSNQSFQTVSNFVLDPEKHVMVLKLLGELADLTPVKESVTVAAKQKCPTCGVVNKATAAYCSSCGTCLTEFK